MAHSPNVVELLLRVKLQGTDAIVRTKAALGQLGETAKKTAAGWEETARQEAAAVHIAMTVAEQGAGFIVTPEQAAALFPSPALPTAGEGVSTPHPFCGGGREGVSLRGPTGGVWGDAVPRRRIRQGLKQSP